MRQSAILLVFCATLTATGTALVALATTLQVGPGISPPIANPGVASAFYSAVNDALHTGNHASLDEVLSPDFAWRTAPPGRSPDAEGFHAALTSLRAVSPRATFVPGSVSANGGWLATRIGIDGTEGGAFLGIPDPLSGTGTASFGLLRVEGGRVAEYWGDPGFPALTTLLHTTVQLGRDTRRSVTLERWTFASNAMTVPRSDIAVVALVVEAGALTVDVDPTSRESSTRLVGMMETRGERREEQVWPQGNTTVLGPGDGLVVTEGGRTVLHNPGMVPAVTLVVTVDAPVRPSRAEAGPVPTTTLPGVEQTVLAGGFTVMAPAPGVTVAFGRAVLAPGTSLPTHRVNATELIAVETGALTMTADENGAWIDPGEGVAGGWANAAEISAGGSAVAEEESVVGYRAEGETPVSVLLVTISGVTQP
jgi:hypothetical protein